MTKNVICLIPNMSLEEAAEVMRENRISGAPVMENEKLVGELSSTDILKIVKKSSLDEIDEYDKYILSEKKGKNFMKKPISIRFDASLSDARKLMERFKIRRLIVVDEKNELQGIITKTDLMKNVIKEKVEQKVFTKIDDILKILEKGPSDIGSIAQKIKASESMVEEWAKILEEHDLIEITYPAMGKAVLKIKAVKEEI